MFFKYNYYYYHLEGICEAVDWYRLSDVLRNLSAGIQKNEQFARKALLDPANHPDYVDAVAYEEGEIVEDLLGAAFVVCQSFITAVVSRVIHLHSYHKKMTGENLKTTDGSKKSITRLGSRAVRKSGFTQIQIIDALANYFKHHEEWRSWRNAKGPAKNTIDVIQTVGVRLGSNENLRIAAKSLGNRTGHNLQIFADILEKWSGELCRRYRRELTKKKLVASQTSSGALK